MFDAHVRAWKHHLERAQMKALLAARFRVSEDWRVNWNTIDQRLRALKERPWRT